MTTEDTLSAGTVAELWAQARALGALGRLARVRPQLPRDLRRYSHSIVPGGFDVMSRTTRLTSRISLIIREAMRSSRS